MPLWAFKANFTNASRRTAEEISFHDMLVKSPRSERKTVTHVYAQSVTHVFAPCREGEGDIRIHDYSKAGILHSIGLALECVFDPLLLLRHSRRATGGQELPFRRVLR